MAVSANTDLTQCLVKLTDGRVVVIEGGGGARAGASPDDGVNAIGEDGKHIVGLTRKNVEVVVNRPAPETQWPEAKSVIWYYATGDYHDNHDHLDAHCKQKLKMIVEKKMWLVLPFIEDDQTTCGNAEWHKTKHDAFMRSHMLCEDGRYACCLVINPECPEMEVITPEENRPDE